MCAYSSSDLCLNLHYSVCVLIQSGSWSKPMLSGVCLSIPDLGLNLRYGECMHMLIQVLIMVYADSMARVCLFKPIPGSKPTPQEACACPSPELGLTLFYG